MIQLITCHKCKGFLALALRACPHCAAPIDRARHLLLGVAGLAGGGAVSMTLMACYGAPCVDENSGPCRYVPDDAAADARQGDAESDAGTDAAFDAPLDGGDAAIDAAAADATQHD